MAVFIVEAEPEVVSLGVRLMLVACLVDATDGTLARRLRVKELLPNFDGAKLDDLIDFLTFTSLPLALVWRAELLPARPRMGAGRGAGGQRLRILPDSGQDDRRLLCRLSFVLEYRGVLSVRAGDCPVAGGSGDPAAGPADVRAELLFVSQPRRDAEPPDQFSGRRVGGAADVDPVGLAP